MRESGLGEKKHTAARTLWHSFTWNEAVRWYIWFLLCCISLGLAAQPRQRSALIQALRMTSHTRQRARLTYELAKAYEPIRIDSARFYGEQSVDLAQRLSDKRLLILVCTEMGHIWDQLSRPDEAKQLLDKALALSQVYRKDTLTAFVYASMASFSFRQGDQAKALQFGLEALRSYERTQTPTSSSLCFLYNILGSVYSALNQSTLALAYYDRQRQLAERLHDSLSIARALGNSGDLYLRLGELDPAEVATRRSLAILNQLNHNFFISVSLSNLGSIYYKKHQYSHAMAYHHHSLAIRQQLGIPIYIARSYFHLAECYFALARYPTVLTYTAQAIALLKRAHTQRTHLQSCLELQARALHQLHRDKEAFVSLDEAMQLKDSLSGVEKTKAVAMVQAAFDLEREQHQILLLSKNASIQQLQMEDRKKQVTALQQAKQTAELTNQLLVQDKLLSRQKLFLQQAIARRQQMLIDRQHSDLDFAHTQRILYCIIIFLLVGVLLLTVYYLQRRHIAQRHVLIQQEAMAQQAQQLATLNATKDRLFSIISHDLRGPLAQLKQRFLQLQRQVQADNFLTTQVQPLADQVDRLLDLMTNLLSWSRSQLLGFQVNRQPIHLATIVLEESYQWAELIKRKDILLIDQVDRQVQVLADQHLLTTVVRNILGNALKFTFPGGYVRISTRIREHEVDLLIRDAGMGMNAQQLAVLFEEPVVRAGTQGEPGTGLGLRLCRELLEKQDSTLVIESEENQGTTVRIRFDRYQAGEGLEQNPTRKGAN